MWYKVERIYMKKWKKKKKKKKNLLPGLSIKRAYRKIPACPIHSVLLKSKEYIRKNKSW
jgi:hypothetical protein